MCTKCVGMHLLTGHIENKPLWFFLSGRGGAKGGQNVTDRKLNVLRFPRRCITCPSSPDQAGAMVVSLLRTWVIFASDRRAFLVLRWEVVLGGARPPHRFDFWHLKVVWPSYEAAAVGKRGSLVWFAGTWFRRRELPPSPIDSPFVCLEKSCKKANPISEPKGCSCAVQPGFV